MSETDTITAIKADLVARNIPLGGDCGAFEITKRAAWELRGLGAGLLKKPGGANCNGFAAGIICFKDGLHYDILFDAGGANTPQWVYAGLVDSARWAPPFEVDFKLPGTDPVTVDEPAALSDLELLQARFDDIVERLHTMALKAAEDREAIQQQIDQVVKNAEATAKIYLPLLGKLGRFLP